MNSSVICLLFQLWLLEQVLLESIIIYMYIHVNTPFCDTYIIRPSFFSSLAKRNFVLKVYVDSASAQSFQGFLCPFYPLKTE